MADKKPISRMNKAELAKLAAKEGVEVPEGASKEQLYDAIRASREQPESEVPPTSGPEDVMSSASVGGEGSVDPETGKTLPREEPYTGSFVEPAKTLVDGGPEPPQPTGGDEPVKPLEQTGAPGFKSEGAVAAAKAEEKIARRAVRLRQEALPEGKVVVSTGIEVGHPRAINTQLTITGRGFPPRGGVRVVLSGSRFPTGEATTTLRASEDGVVQAIIFPSPGEQSVSMSAEGASATADFDVVDPSRR